MQDPSLNKGLKRIIEEFPYYTAVCELISPDKSPVIIEINEPGPQLHGYTKEELTGKPASFLDSDVQKGNIKEYLQEFDITQLLSDYKNSNLYEWLKKSQKIREILKFGSSQNVVKLLLH